MEFRLSMSTQNICCLSTSASLTCRWVKAPDCRQRRGSCTWWIMLSWMWVRLGERMWHDCGGWHLEGGGKRSWSLVRSMIALSGSLFHVLKQRHGANTHIHTHTRWFLFFMCTSHRLHASPRPCANVNHYKYLSYLIFSLILFWH